MDKKTLKHFKEKLEKQKKGLMSHAGDTVEIMSSQKEKFPDPTDRASHEAERNFELRIRDRENKLIKKIDRTFERMQNGTFGICEKCGGTIRENRLKIRTVTTKCIDCKTKEEAIENAIEK